MEATWSPLGPKPLNRSAVVRTLNLAMKEDGEGPAWACWRLCFWTTTEVAEHPGPKGWTGSKWQWYHLEATQRSRDRLRPGTTLGWVSAGGWAEFLLSAEHVGSSCAGTSTHQFPPLPLPATELDIQDPHHVSLGGGYFCGHHNIWKIRRWTWSKAIIKK